jgi:N-acetylmuramic acid 6-phosphate etherase
MAGESAEPEGEGRHVGSATSRWGVLLTESRHPGSLDLDTRPPEEVVALVLEEDRRGLDAVLRHVPELGRAAGWVAETLRAGGDVVFAGAGTSGRLGVLEAAECPPTFGTDPQRIRAVIAGGEEAIFRAQEGAEDREADGRRAVDELAAGDLVVGLSASSVTPYVRGALDAAREGGVRTVLLTCAAPVGLDGLADLVIALETGPEVLTGSTRLKAGSATKAALNAITTAAMVELGKVFENLMVDLRPGSAKLEDRARRIVEAAGKVTRLEADRLYAAAGRDVKTAIVMARREVDADAARRLLERATGNIRRALAVALD